MADLVILGLALALQAFLCVLLAVIRGRCVRAKGGYCCYQPFGYALTAVGISLAVLAAYTVCKLLGIFAEGGRGAAAAVMLAVLACDWLLVLPALTWAQVDGDGICCHSALSGKISFSMADVADFRTQEPQGMRRMGPPERRCDLVIILRDRRTVRLPWYQLNVPLLANQLQEYMRNNLRKPN